MRYCLLLFAYVLFALALSAQELPPVLSFESDVYKAGSQNWMLGQDANDFIYVANNDGLLEYNGRQWTLYPSPNESIVRSVKAIGERIYTGSYTDFGYWVRTLTGELEYHSLGAGVRSRMMTDEHFWNIISHDGFVVFQSLHQFFLYDPVTEDVGLITPVTGIFKSFMIADELYFTDSKKELYQLVGGAILPVATTTDIGNVVHLWKQDRQLLAQTETNGCFVLDRGSFRADRRHGFLSGKRVYSATSLRRGGLVFGTISNGIYIVDENGDLEYHLDQVQGLTNNTILTLFEDARSNLWAGTDNGISCVNLYAPFRKFTDNTGLLGTVHAAAVFGDNLYLGTNQGLFVRTRGAEADFRLVENTRGQVWSLFPHEGQLFCGHNAGTFLVEDRRVRQVSDIEGTWTFDAVPGRPDLLVQGNYRGLSVIEKRGDGWQLRNTIEGFDYSARFFALRPGPEVFVSHEYRGVYGLRLDADLRRVTEQQAYPVPTKGKNAGLIAFQDSVYYLSRRGMFVLENFEEGFQPAANLNAVIDSTDYSSGKMTVTGERLWFFTKNALSFFSKSALKGGLKRHTIPVPAGLISVKSGYENIAPSGIDSLLIGTSDGYLLIALSAEPMPRHKLHLTRLTAEGGDRPARAVPLTDDLNLPAVENNLNFYFAVPIYSKYFTPRFQYRLLGFHDAWSEWSPRSGARFAGLPFGDYILEARSMLGQRAAEETISFAFTVRRPWYLSYPALVLYLLFGLVLAWLLHRSYSGYYHRKEKLWQAENERKLAAERRESELALSKLNNEQLQQDISAKSREMAQSTMSLVKKNELLQQIKDKLLEGKNPEDNIRKVIQTIDKNIDEAETWNLFKDAFESADRDFFRKVKERHPGLTPNDLKLCAYLRLNLSSKEIAPMLNISVRSVEVKRYRLRKKMKLKHEVGLADYILAL